MEFISFEDSSINLSFPSFSEESEDHRDHQNDQASPLLKSTCTTAAKSIPLFPQKNRFGVTQVKENFKSKAKPMSKLLVKSSIANNSTSVSTNNSTDLSRDPTESPLGSVPRSPLKNMKLTAQTPKPCGDASPSNNLRPENPESHISGILSHFEITPKSTISGHSHSFKTWLQFDIINSQPQTQHIIHEESPNTCSSPKGEDTRFQIDTNIDLEAMLKKNSHFEEFYNKKMDLDKRRKELRQKNSLLKNFHRLPFAEKSAKEIPWFSI